MWPASSQEPVLALPGLNIADVDADQAASMARRPVTA
jgi:hypothetical protein